MQPKVLSTTLLLALSLAAADELSAQRFAYVNTDYILSQMDEYTEAQASLDQVAEQWRKEIAVKKQAIEKMYRDFQNDRVLLTKEQEKLRIKEIEARETELKEFQQGKFGYEGELFQKREELIKPIQDKVYNAIQQLANDRGYDFVFDQANSTTILFADSKNDRSDDILRNLGISKKN